MNLRRFPVFATTALLLLACLFPGSADAGPDSVLLRIKGEKGDTHVYTQKEKSTMSFSMEGIPLPELKMSIEDLVMRSVVDMTLSVEEVTDEGNFVLHLLVGDPELSFSGGVFPFTQGDLMEMISSIASSQMSGREAAMMRKEMEKAMQGQNEMTFTVTDRGKPLGIDFPLDQQGMNKREARQINEMISRIFERLPSSFPEKAVRPGDAWSVTYDLPDLLSGMGDQPQFAMIGGMLNLPVIVIDFKVEGYEVFEDQEYLKIDFNTEGGWDVGALLGMISGPLSASPMEISGRSFSLTGLDFDAAWESSGYMLYDYHKGLMAKSFSDTSVIMEANGRLKESGGEGLDWPLKVRMTQNSLEQAILN